ncbi:hypothetical protein B2J88_42860 [Rhodococcus sp. SRB_17]|nr:hypothetical protein [Rhodococcus sp. SRB_17]
MPDGAWTDESFESDKDAIRCATEVNRGVGDNVVVEQDAKNGHLIPTTQTRAAHATRRKKHPNNLKFNVEAWSTAEGQVVVRRKLAFIVHIRD